MDRRVTIELTPRETEIWREFEMSRYRNNWCIQVAQMSPTFKFDGETLGGWITGNQLALEKIADLKAVIVEKNKGSWPIDVWPCQAYMILEGRCMVMVWDDQEAY